MDPHSLCREAGPQPAPVPITPFQRSSANIGLHPGKRKRPRLRVVGPFPIRVDRLATRREHRLPRYDGPESSITPVWPLDRLRFLPLFPARTDTCRPWHPASSAGRPFTPLRRAGVPFTPFHSGRLPSAPAVNPPLDRTSTAGVPCFRGPWDAGRASRCDKGRESMPPPLLPLSTVRTEVRRPFTPLQRSEGRRYPPFPRCRRCAGAAWPARTAPPPVTRQETGIPDGQAIARVLRLPERRALWGAQFGLSRTSGAAVCRMK
jgi:hypothetical protein